MRKWMIFLALVIMLKGCAENKYPHYDLPIDEIYQYSTGDTLIYKSNDSRFDTLIVDRVSRTYEGDNAFGYSSEFYELQTVILHFKKDEDSISPSIFWDHDMKVSFNTSSNSEIFAKDLRWKKYPRFDLKDIQTFDSIFINEINYDKVHILNRAEEPVDSSMEFNTIYFNFKFGILKYDNGGDEIFYLFRKL